MLGCLEISSDRLNNPSPLNLTCHKNLRARTKGRKVLCHNLTKNL
jgi:hypothetical protein